MILHIEELNIFVDQFLEEFMDIVSTLKLNHVFHRKIGEDELIWFQIGVDVSSFSQWFDKGLQRMLTQGHLILIWFDVTCDHAFTDVVGVVWD